MTAPDLARRDPTLRELMDDPDCDLVRLERTYGQFRVVNRLLSGWRRLYRQRIRPLLDTAWRTTLLDIGSGGGDIARALAGWAARDGLALDITAIDPDERAVGFARRSPAAGVHFEQAASADLVARGDRYDVVVSNHLLHHLDAAQLTALLDDSLALTGGLVLHNDLARARPGYAFWAAATRPLARRSFLHEDGLLSIRRSYRRAELEAVVPPGWRVETMVPQRLLLSAGRSTR
ncbi:class I SAM-dependent methyltransferase [Desertihabitans aurantiacus]|uniref:class I SAM-dependent methyltransferase n=1 Tax=Desertihabitans aurantiacus TaxID=2282477 RepID=UPI0018E56A33|nr:class I SAM-dependent methyltransferase [Desertihabitans aurantiacus]